MTADLFVRNSELLAPLYGAGIPSLDSIRLRSVHLNWRGPSVTLRLDLPAPPLPLPDAWVSAGVNAVQCQLQFLAVDDLVLRTWKPPLICGVVVTELPADEHRVHIAVAAVQDPVLRFTCHADVLAGHLSGFRLGPKGEDSGPHVFRSKVDALRHASIPDPSEKTFYERL